MEARAARANDVYEYPETPNAEGPGLVALGHWRLGPKPTSLFNAAVETALLRDLDRMHLALG
jgi:hypothetical protein